MSSSNRDRLERSLDSLRIEWREAPWFVILMILIAAFVGPGLLWAAWNAITNLF